MSDAQPPKIKELAPDDRPREKLLRKGEKALTDSELLAILLNSGTRNKPVITLAQELLKKVNNDLNRLVSLSVQEMMEINGIGYSRALTLKAAFELSNRRNFNYLAQKESIRSSQQAFLAIKIHFMDVFVEKFYVILLNRANKIVDILHHTTGGTNGTVVDVKWIVRKVILNNASSVILAHNHPGGNLQPSAEDKHITQKIKSALEYIDTKLIDHLIIHQDTYFSFADERLL